MKLLHDFFRWPFAGVRAVASQPAALPRDFSVTVPAPLAAPANDAPKTPEIARNERREPASFLRSPRRRRLGCTHR
ncbi:MAG: hypothetical protein WBA49_10870 [Rhodanobacter lindaniclasticus]